MKKQKPWYVFCSIQRSVGRYNLLSSNTSTYSSFDTFIFAMTPYDGLNYFFYLDNLRSDYALYVKSRLYCIFT